MKKSIKLTLALSSSILLAACGSDDESSATGVSDESGMARASDVTTGDQTYKSLIGIDASSAYAYYDLDTNTQLDLNDESAKTNTEWDVAFYSTNIILNGGYSGPGEIEASFTGNNSDFRDDQGSADADKFINATAETELADFLAVTEYASDTEFVTDEFMTVFGSDFYSYNFMTHSVSANTEQVYLISNTDGIYKVRMTALAADGSGYAIGDVTVGVQFAVDNQADFSDEALISFTCSEQSYIDLSAYDTVEVSDAWDFTVKCSDFEVQLGADVTARKILDEDDVDHIVSYIDTDYEGYYLTTDYADTVFKHQFKWYEYNLNLESKIWSQFGVYLIKTPTTTYKFQPTGYYNLVDGEVTSRQISFIYDEVSEASPVIE